MVEENLNFSIIVSHSELNLTHDKSGAVCFTEPVTVSCRVEASGLIILSYALVVDTYHGLVAFHQALSHSCTALTIMDVTSYKEVDAVLRATLPLTGNMEISKNLSQLKTGRKTSLLSKLKTLITLHL
jgi:hypothetical protein